MPRQTLTHSRKMIEEEDYNIHPGIGTESHNRSNCKKRHKSMGKAKTKIFPEVNKFKKEEHKMISNHEKLKTRELPWFLKDPEYFVIKRVKYSDEQQTF